MKDIAPGLLDKIQKDFAEALAKSPVAKRLDDLIEKGLATHGDSLKYAQEVGDILRKVFAKHLTADALPDGRMYYNIAKRILEPTLTSEHHIVANMAARVQEVLNANAGLGLKGIKPPPDEWRIKGIVDRLAVEEDFDKIKWILDEPIRNFAQHVVDETVRVNADFHFESGMSPTITRTVVSETCDWCDKLAGVYKYEDVKETGNPVFMRHERCDCLVEYDPGDGKKVNVHSKKAAGSAEDIAWQKQVAKKREERRAEDAEWNKRAEAVAKAAAERRAKK